MGDPPFWGGAPPRGVRGGAFPLVWGASWGPGTPPPGGAYPPDLGGLGGILPSQSRTLIWKYWSILALLGAWGGLFWPPDPPLGGSDPPWGVIFGPRTPLRGKKPPKRAKNSCLTVSEPRFDGKFGRKPQSHAQPRVPPWLCTKRGVWTPPKRGGFDPKMGVFWPPGTPPQRGGTPPGGSGGVFPLVLGGVYPPPRPPFWGGLAPRSGGLGGILPSHPVPSYGNIGLFLAKMRFCLASSVPSYGNIGNFGRNSLFTSQSVPSYGNIGKSAILPSQFRTLIWKYRTFLAKSVILPSQFRTLIWKYRTFFG